MNNLQVLASDIGGYGIHETGARDDGYYEAKNKIAYLNECLNGYKFNLSKEELEKVIVFLAFEGSQNDHFYAFKELE